MTLFVFSVKEKPQMITLTPEDRALLDACDFSPDLPPRIGLRSSVLQAGSKELLPGDSRHMPGAAAGDIVLRHERNATLVKGAAGFAAVPIAFKTRYVEWLPNRTGFVAEWETKPADADWRKGPDGRKCCLRVNGNKIEETIVAHLLVDGCGILFPFRSSAVPVGREFEARAAHVRVNIDGRDVEGFTYGKWLVATRLHQENDFPWFLPVVTLIGRLGEKDGPAIEEWRLATHARVAHQAGDDWDPAKPARAAAAGGAGEAGMAGAKAASIVGAKTAAVAGAKAADVAPPHEPCTFCSSCTAFFTPLGEINSASTPAGEGNTWWTPRPAAFAWILKYRGEPLPLPAGPRFLR
jgi:hypothetical protein